ncbi:MAG: hypothetical protein A3B30_00405 [Candidatus Komeilibacteria bacterium RIFCSPLOWO2_01_FULL_52_15]|uniref:ABC transporter n=1 Tax=Candidatus Komeilibacteria bacterium RIFCSPLOWO2_01_FULL_52_15 TaxID=1798551 RepID=A0A1G2BRP3_9BACT|nr:MAG: hypothetical protein A3B30_00405 [Candidatus Komeilibacteria bacterium RIFCSPLOWO2_01_FULL_52_15]
MNIDVLSFTLAILTAIASGLVGSFALMRRMALAGDALSHVALPGIGIALLYSYNPIAGAAVSLIIGAVIVWQIERASHLNTEAIIGVLFAFSLAIGAVAIGDDQELVDTLFGGVTRITGLEFAIGILVAAVIIRFIIRSRRALVISLVSKELAKTASVSTEKLQFLFLVTFALTVLLGLKFLGVLLMGSLIIIPAAAARNVARNLNGMLVIASTCALLSVVLGMFIASTTQAQLGPTIIIIASVFFVISIFLRPLSSQIP